MKQYKVRETGSPLELVDHKNVGEARGLDRVAISQLVSWSIMVFDKLELNVMTDPDTNATYLIKEDGRYMEGYITDGLVYMNYWSHGVAISESFRFDNYAETTDFYEAVNNFFDGHSNQSTIISPDIARKNLKDLLNTPIESESRIDPENKVFSLPSDGIPLVLVDSQNRSQIGFLTEHELSRINAMAISIRKHLGLSMYIHPDSRTFLISGSGDYVEGHIGVQSVILKYSESGREYSKTYTESAEIIKHFETWSQKMNVTDASLPPETVYDEWTKDDNGAWHHPRYPSGQDRPRPGLKVEYFQPLNDSKLTLDGTEVKLSFGELSILHSQIGEVLQRCRAENAELWKQKLVVMEQEEGSRLRGPVKSAYDLYE